MHEIDISQGTRFINRQSPRRAAAIAAVIVALMLCARRADAGLYYYTFDGNLDSKTQSATALFEFGANSLKITVSNLVVDPVSVIQNISGLVFKIDSASTVTGASLTSSSATKVSVSGTGVATVGATGSTGWGFSRTGQLLELSWNAFGDTNPRSSGTIIGLPNASTNKYSAAQGSIAGNNPHNPFLSPSPVIFNLSIAGVTSSSKLVDDTQSVLMQFGTTQGSNRITGIDPPPPRIANPEPGSLLVFGGLAIFMGAVRHRSRRKTVAAA